jgi:hypothetical protein
MKNRKTLTDEQLRHLSRQEKLDLLDALDEQRRREIEKSDVYKPNTGQRPVHRSQKTVRAVFAGNGGGKTALGVNEVIWALDGYNPISKRHTKVPCRVIVVLDKPEKVADVWLPEIKKWTTLKAEQLHKRGKPYYSQIIRDNGSELLFMFHDQDPMSFESLELDIAVFDEPPPRPVYVSLRRGGRKKGSTPKFLIIGTPIAASWMRKEIYEPWARGEAPDTECFRYGTEANKENLADGYIESFSSVLNDKEKRIRLHGEFFDLEGLALAHVFNRASHLIPPPRWPDLWPTVIAIDFHPRKSHTAVLLGITKDNDLVVLKEMSSRAIPSVFAREIREFYKGYRVTDILCDSLGSSELTGGEGNLSFIQVLKDHGVRVRATRWVEKQDEAWVQMIQEVLAVPLEADNFGRKEPRLKIVNTCKGLIADIETVEWARYKNIDEFKPKLAIDAKDFLSCLKYALAAQPSIQKIRAKTIKPTGGLGWNNRRKVT